MSMNNLANMVFLEGRYGDAEKLEGEARVIFNAEQVSTPPYLETSDGTALGRARFVVNVRQRIFGASQVRSRLHLINQPCLINEARHS